MTPPWERYSKSDYTRLTPPVSTDARAALGAREDRVLVQANAITASFSAVITLPAARDDRPGKNAGSHPRDRHYVSLKSVLAPIARGTR
jgi:hypothetical protein